MNEALFAALCILSLLDAMTTVQILKRGGRELNGALVRLMNMVGVQPALWIVKLGLIGLLAVSWREAWISGPMLTAVLLLTDIAFGVIVYHNIVEIEKQRQ